MTFESLTLKPFCLEKKTVLEMGYFIVYATSSVRLRLKSGNICKNKRYDDYTRIYFYQLPLILIALLHVDLINVAYLTACAFIRS